jgi:hypothetical protein
MSKDSPERKYFNKSRDSLIRNLGSKALYDDQINAIGKRLFPTWSGVFPVDRAQLLPYHYCIINTDPHNKSGSHWIACYCTAKRAYIWDSYSRDPKKLVPQLINTIHAVGLQLGKTNTIPQHEQIGDTSEVCGVLSLAFLLTVKKLGIERAKNI